MKGERILNIGPYRIGREGMERIVETFPEDEHIFVGSTDSLPGLEALAKTEIKPTVAIVQDFSKIEMTTEMVRNVKQLFPDIEVVAFGASEAIEGADHQLGMLTGRQGIKDFLLELQHEPKSIFIDPARKQEYLGILDQAFDAWHKKEWYFVSKEYFTTISRASFLSYLQYLVTASDEKGRIDLVTAKAGLEKEMDEYFRQEKLDNALRFFKEDDWQELIQK